MHDITSLSENNSNAHPTPSPFPSDFDPTVFCDKINDSLNSNVGIKTFDFNDFADRENLLRDEYGCYKNKLDNIHLGSWGIITFACKIKKAVLGPHTDTRDYASVVKSDDGTSHSNDILPS